MRNRLRDLCIDELLVHDIPKKLAKKALRNSSRNREEGPIYSQAPSRVDAGIKNFFRDKIVSTIGSSSAFDVIVDLDNASPVPGLVQQYLYVDGGERILLSQKIAAFLYEKQTAANSAGLLLFVRCSIAGEIVLAILKVEREEGIRVQGETTDAGLFIFDIEHIRNLMLTEKTKLFKIALLWEKNALLKGVICDQQRSSNIKLVADFFISDFLGCMLTEHPEITTKRFYETTVRFLNEHVESAEKKAEFLNHLTSELTSQNCEINPVVFANRSLPGSLRDIYVRFIAENASITNGFRKDILLIEKHLGKIQYGFASGITVIGAKDAFNEKTTLKDTEDGLAQFEIIDELKKVISK